MLRCLCREIVEIVDARQLAVMALSATDAPRSHVLRWETITKLNPLYLLIR
jgi:hypothetical protein